MKRVITYRARAAIITSVTVAEGIGGLWWWALAGMNLRVADASILTFCIGAVATAIAWLVALA